MSVPRRKLSSDDDWIRWGRRDPLWAVATEPGRERDGKSPWTDSEFYETGVVDWSTFFSHWRSYGVRLGACVEIGCGAGRITRQLAATFHSVHAVDVSPDMIRYAKSAFAADRIQYHLSEGLGLPVPDNSVDAVFSTHVLQHFDSESSIVDCFRECFRVLADGGTLMIHVPVVSWPGFGRIARLHSLFHAGLLQISHVLAYTRRKLGMPVMRGTSIQQAQVFRALEAMGFAQIEIRTFKAPRDHTVMSFVMATK